MANPMLYNVQSLLQSMIKRGRGVEYNIRVDTILLAGLHELADLFGPGGGDQSSGVKSLTMKLVDNQTFEIRCSI